MSQLVFLSLFEIELSSDQFDMCISMLLFCLVYTKINFKTKMSQINVFMCILIYNCCYIMFFIMILIELQEWKFKVNIQSKILYFR